MIVEVKESAGAPGKPNLVALVIESRGEFAGKYVLSALERAKLAMELVGSLIAPDDSERSEALRALYRDLINVEAEIANEESSARAQKAYLLAMNAAKERGADSKDAARAMVNEALGRPPEDRANLSVDEWSRAAETLRERGKE